ncbi:MAG: L-lactate dehydrogenase [Actinobacteria bacterium]|nr:L-lactate dehydrogenase [Actinomycetota bacterium]
MKGEDLQPVVKVGVVGTGMVGSTFAYSLMSSGLASEIILVDVNRKRAEGEVMDLDHAMPFAKPARIWAGDYSDFQGARIVVITAGIAQKPGETRLDLVNKNTAIFRDIIQKVAEYAGESIILVATNPVDIMTYAALKLSGFPSQRVIGSGTILDTARLRFLLGQYFKVDPRSVHSYIIGEHGDLEVPAWSLTHIAGARLTEYCACIGREYRQPELDALFIEARDAAYQIIERKGATYWAIGAGLVRIVESIVRDENSILAVSSLMDGEYGVQDVCLSLPSVVNTSGVDRVLDLPISPGEKEGFIKSADVLKKLAKDAGL